MFERLKKAVVKEIKERFSKNQKYFQEMEEKKLVENWYICEIFKEKNIKKQNREIFGYGSGDYTLPHFEGGVGVSCYPSIFEKIGFVFQCVASGKMFDAYTISRKPKTRKTRANNN